jgi:N-glycosylase/DNA lyase
MNIFESGNKIVLENIENFDLTDIFECGQCFRFNKSGESYEGVAYGKYLHAYQKNDKIYLETSIEDFNNIWRRFFDLDRDYKHIFEQLRQDKTLRKASDFCPGLRILKQEPFECLISFIISQNNNIPRIKKIIERLCENFGEKITGDIYAFPTIERLAGLSLSDLEVIKSGFRAKYILDAAQKVNSGEINLDLIYDLNLEDSVQYLKNIKGVGDKVSACVALFAYNKLDAFPIDVWIKKIIGKYYPDGYNFGEYAGIANAYLFYYERNTINN